MLQEKLQKLKTSKKYKIITVNCKYNIGRYKLQWIEKSFLQPEIPKQHSEFYGETHDVACFAATHPILCKQPIIVSSFVVLDACLRTTNIC